MTSLPLECPDPVMIQEEGMAVFRDLLTTGPGEEGPGDSSQEGQSHGTCMWEHKAVGLYHQALLCTTHTAWAGDRATLPPHPSCSLE